jgi:DeoR/GlpR family transcriptional regulator of sugar metabolism
MFKSIREEENASWNRRLQIIRYSAKPVTGSGQDLARQLDVSEMTIRRDLIGWSSGLFFPVHGEQ